MAGGARVWVAVQAEKVDVGLNKRAAVFCAIHMTICRGGAWEETAVGVEGEAGTVGVFVCVEKDVCAVVLVVTLQKLILALWAVMSLKGDGRLTLARNDTAGGLGCLVWRIWTNQRQA